MPRRLTPPIVSVRVALASSGLRLKGDFLIVYLAVVQEAMRANMVNTMMEALVPDRKPVRRSSLMAILSNLATESLGGIVLAHASSVVVHPSLARKWRWPSQLKPIGPYRAATHNKGIFNGIDA